MGAETTLYSALKDNAGVAAIVSARIYPNAIPQKTALPAICYTRADTEYITTIHSAVPVGSFVDMEVWCMAKTEAESSSLADASEIALGLANIPLVNRRHEYDSETEVTAVVLTIRF